MNTFYLTVTTFGPRFAPSSGHNNTRKCIHIENKNCEAGDLHFYIKVRSKQLSSTQGKNSKNYTSPEDVLEIPILV
jgi:hypothetical protein